MPQIKIDVNDLPELPEGEDNYYVRMRVVSTDENRTSYWVYSKIQVPDVSIDP